MKFKTEVKFSAGKLVKLNNLEFMLENNDNSLEFFVKAKDIGNEYSLNFKTKVSLEEMLEFKVGEKINFLNFIDEGDIVFG